MGATQRSDQEPVLVMAGVHKSFAGVRALVGANLRVNAGQVHGLVGENGAGKSTLMHILSGSVPADAGQVVWHGRPMRFLSPIAAQSAGIAMIHQELSLVPSTSVVDNVMLGHEPVGRFGLLRTREMAARACDLMTQLATPIDVNRRVEEFPIAIQQMIEVAKALSHGAGLIIMDEPTSALSDAEVDKLFDTIRTLKQRGVSVIYISHKMEEIYAICDHVTVLRDGADVGTGPTDQVDSEALIQWMVGRTIDQLFPRHEATPGAELLSVRGLTLSSADGAERKLLDNVSLSVRAGEIVGLAGLRGSGASELMGSVFGRYGPRPRGEICLEGAPVRLSSPHTAIEHGIAMLTNDRKATGLVLPMSVLHNMTLAALPQVSPGALVRRRAEIGPARRLAESLNVRAPSLDCEVSALSGGNQQKVALAKWLMTRPRLLLLDEPTRGIDVGAKTEIYHLMNRLVSDGKGIVLTTSELPELLAMSDRIVVLHRGRVSAHLSRDEATQENVIAAAMESEAHG